MKSFPSTYFLRSPLKDIQKNIFLHMLLSNNIKLPFLVAVVGVAEGETNSATHFCSLYDWTIDRERVRERGREWELKWEKKIVGLRQRGSMSSIYLTLYYFAHLISQIFSKPPAVPVPRMRPSGWSWPEGRMCVCERVGVGEWDSVSERVWRSVCGSVWTCVFECVWMGGCVCDCVCVRVSECVHVCLWERAIVRETERVGKMIKRRYDLVWVIATWDVWV